MKIINSSNPYFNQSIFNFKNILSFISSMANLNVFQLSAKLLKKFKSFDVSLITIYLFFKVYTQLLNKIIIVLNKYLKDMF
jgi:hypothetical protein